MPSQDAIWVFEELSDDDAIPQEFLAYFESTYIGIERGTRNNRRRATPTFPICFWNVYSRVVNSLPRTNNNVEAFHNALNKSVSNAHPNIWRLINVLKDEECLATAKRIHFERGDSLPDKKKYKDLNARLKNIVLNYSAYDDKMRYLRSIAYNMHVF